MSRPLGKPAKIADMLVVTKRPTYPKQISLKGGQMSENNLTTKELARFKSKYEILSNGCFKWLGAPDKGGYGEFKLRGKKWSAHRLSWFIMYGPIPADMVINHICRNRSCVNHQHLCLFSKRQNVLLDSVAITAINSKKTFCPKGHPYDRVYDKKRYCSICQNETLRRSRLKYKELALHDKELLPAINIRKTHCQKGHEYDRVYNRTRVCSICKNENKRRLRLKWKENAQLQNMV
jgi:HNH endonuclease